MRLQLPDKKNGDSPGVAEARRTDEQPTNRPQRRGRFATSDPQFQDRIFDQSGYVSFITLFEN
jgi:hypothetical protein